MGIKHIPFSLPPSVSLGASVGGGVSTKRPSSSWHLWRSWAFISSIKSHGCHQDQRRFSLLRGWKPKKAKESAIDLSSSSMASTRDISYRYRKSLFSHFCSVRKENKKKNCVLRPLWNCSWDLGLDIANSTTVHVLLLEQLCVFYSFPWNWNLE